MIKTGKYLLFAGTVGTVYLPGFAEVPVAAKAAADTTTVSAVTAPAAFSDSALSPAAAMGAMRGLSQTASAEPMGEGRLTIGITGTWYGQKANPPLQEADILTGTLAFCYGVNRYVDIFGSVAGYGMFADATQTGLGSVSGGIRGTLPLPELSFMLLGVQMGINSGTSSIKLNDNNYSGYLRSNTDGYDYFITSQYYDFIGSFLETFTFGNDSLGVKIHLNQGAAMMLHAGNQQLLLLGAGVQAAANPKIVLGLEVHSRTNINDPHNQTDPLWLTPSLLFRTPYCFNALVGADVSLSKEREWNGTRALEPFRLFGSVAFSIDLLAAKRRADRQKALREKTEWHQKVKKMEKRSEVIASTARVDSSAKANAIDSLKRMSVSLVRQVSDDSATMVELKRKLDLERSKRSDAEKQLLSTGLLLLDAVYFETGKSQISINSYPYLNIIGKMLTKYPKLQIEVAGHTDNTGRFNKNILLSQARAESVRRYLIQVTPDLLTRISARGYGPTQPKATNRTREGRKLNRRTELKVLNKEALQEYN